jgi:hypothetical protein
MALFERVESRRAIAGQLTLFGVWLGITVIGAVLTPNRHGHGTHQQLGLPPCPSVMLFDRPCPGCGLTTSFTATIHGRFAEAFQAHPFGTVAYGLLTVAAILSIVGFCRVQRVTPSRQINFGLGVLVAVFLLFGAARWIMMPNYSAPGEVAWYLIHRANRG